MKQKPYYNIYIVKGTFAYFFSEMCKGGDVRKCTT